MIWLRQRRDRKGRLPLDVCSTTRSEIPKPRALTNRHGVALACPWNIGLRDLQPHQKVALMAVFQAPTMVS